MVSDTAFTVDIDPSGFLSSSVWLVVVVVGGGGGAGARGDRGGGSKP